MDTRLQQLSYSSMLSLHSCPRAFQLYKLNSKTSEFEDIHQSLTFLFGHTVGAGIQLLMEGNSYDNTLWKLFLAWDMDLFDLNPKQQKSFWHAMAALELFTELRDSGFLAEYDLMYFNGKPACELSFRIALPNGFRYRGFVDAVLRNRETGEAVVLEIKTTSSSTSLNPAQYKNSAQAIGYSIVLDHLFPGLSSYQVIYLPYLTKAREWQPAYYDKNHLQRALWLQELLLDIQTIQLYENTGVYPMHGESCFSFYRECEYFNLCTLSIENLIKPASPETESKIAAETYDVEVTFEDLIQAQLSKES